MWGGYYQLALALHRVLEVALLQRDAGQDLERHGVEGAPVDISLTPIEE